MFYAAIPLPPYRSEPLCRAPFSSPHSAMPADRASASPDRHAGGRHSLMGLALAAGFSAICWASLAALVF